MRRLGSQPESASKFRLTGKNRQFAREFSLEMTWVPASVKHNRCNNHGFGWLAVFSGEVVPMCGIAGAIDLTGADRMFSLGRLRAMTDAIVHRGPDDAGAHVEPGLALGARRLAIVDLAGGHQPIGNEDDSIWVAFNGELFEYPEIRRNLLQRGHHLATRCDTEAWVHLFEDHGEGVFHRARGQFAVSLWDRRARTLFLGRDRVGICPLFYAQADGWLIWGSEVKAILAAGLVTATPDLKGLDYFFNFFSASPSRTVFDGIRLIPPGHYLKVRDGRVQVQQYWDLDFPRRWGTSDAWPTRPPWWTSWKTTWRRRSSADSGAMCRWRATSAGGWIPPSSWGWPPASGASPSPRTRSASMARGRTSGHRRRSRPGRWAPP